MDTEKFTPKIYHIDKSTCQEINPKLTISDLKGILEEDYKLSVLYINDSSSIKITCYTKEQAESLRAALLDKCSAIKTIDNIMDGGEAVTESTILESEVYAPKKPTIQERFEEERALIYDWIVDHNILNDANMVTINEDNTIDVIGDVDLSESMFSKLPYYIQFNEVDGNFNVSGNTELKTTEGFPKKINESLDLRECPNLSILKWSGNVKGEFLCD